MTRVLFIASTKPQFGVFADSVRKFRAQGAQTFLAGTFHLESNAEALAATELDGTHQLPRSLTCRSAAVRRKASRSPLGMRVWLQSKGDGWLRHEARHADVLVALDPGAVYTVWRLAQHYRIEEAHFGIAPALKAVGRLKGKGATGVQRGVPPPLEVVKRDVKRSVDGLPAAVMRRATARPVMRSAVGARMWRTAVTAPGLPANVRIATSRYVAEGMQWAGRTSGAALALSCRGCEDPRPGAEGPAAGRGRDEGAPTRHQPARPRQGGLRPADAGRCRFAVGDHGKAAAALDRALFLAFHRVLHIDQLTSPLAKNAEGFVAPLYRSSAVQALSRPQGRKSPAAPTPKDRLRLLVTTSANANFLGHILTATATIRTWSCGTWTWPRRRRSSGSRGRAAWCCRIVCRAEPATTRKRSSGSCGPTSTGRTHGVRRLGGGSRRDADDHRPGHRSDRRTAAQLRGVHPLAAHDGLLAG